MKKFIEALQNGGVVPVGMDDGFDESKVVLPDGNNIRVPSLARSGAIETVSIDDSVQKTFVYETGSGVYTTGEILESDSTAFDDYPVSGMNRAIVSHALRVAGLNINHQLAVCSGLPLKRIYRGSSINKALVAAKTANLKLNDVKSKDGYKLPVIAQHIVIAEGLAAWFDFVIERDADGKLIRNAENYAKRTAIIDIGGKTTDIAVVQAGALDYDRSSTIDCGMLNVKDKIRESIFNDFDGVELTNEQVYTALHEGRVKMFGKWEGVTDVVRNAEIDIANRIHSECSHKLKKAADIDEVIFVGGTVSKIEPHLDGWFRQQRIADEPNFANGRGMQKYVELMVAKSK